MRATPRTAVGWASGRGRSSSQPSSQRSAAWLQLGLYLGGVRLKTTGVHAAAVQTIVFAVLMLVCAVGMWFMRYWAVLGFMALLAILVVLAAVALIKVSSMLGLVVALAIVGFGGFLFWKLVRVLSRIQMPKYPGT